MIETEFFQDPNHNLRSPGALTQFGRFTPAAIIFLGPPGAGKGTQARHLANQFSLPYIGTGEVFRAHVANKTELGMQAAEAMHSGRLVGDRVVCGMLAEHIQTLKGTGSCLILDGFPRSVPQAQWLDQFLHVWKRESREALPGAPLVIQINVAREQVVRRLAGRRYCPACGRVYHLQFQPPLEFGICDQDGTKLEIRPDDREDVILERLNIHHQNASPLTEYYRRKCQLREIDGNGTAHSVRAAIASMMNMLTV